MSEFASQRLPTSLQVRFNFIRSEYLRYFNKWNVSIGFFLSRSNKKLYLLKCDAINNFVAKINNVYSPVEYLKKNKVKNNVKSNVTKNSFLNAISKAKELINNGEIFQVWLHVIALYYMNISKK